MNYSKRLAKELINKALIGELGENCILFVGGLLFEHLIEEGEIVFDERAKWSTFYNMPVYSSPQMENMSYGIATIKSHGGKL